MSWSPEDVPYFQKRAEQEQRWAETAACPAAADAHARLAAFYLDRMHGHSGEHTTPAEDESKHGRQS